MKRVISIFVSVLIILSMFTVAFSASNSPEIIVAKVAGSPGENVSISVDFLNNPGINCYSLSLDYDSDVLTLVSVTPSEQVGGQFAFAKKAVWFTSGNCSYNGTFLTLNFTVNDTAKAGTSTVNVSYNPGDICNYNEEDINFTVVSGGVEISSGTTEPGENPGDDPIVDPTDSPFIEVGCVNAKVGNTVTVPVSFGNNPGINSYSLSIEYDQSILTLENADPAAEVGGQFAFAKKAVWFTSGNSTYNGVYIYLTFKVNEGASAGDTSVSVSYNPGDICNYNEEDVNFTVVPGTITITSSVTYGDVNTDGKIDNTDLSIFKRFLKGANVTVNTSAADVNVSGSVDNTDVALLTRFLKGANVTLG